MLEAEAQAVCEGPQERGCLLCERGETRLLAWLHWIGGRLRGVGKQVLWPASVELQGIPYGAKDERPQPAPLHMP